MVVLGTCGQQPVWWWMLLLAALSTPGLRLQLMLHVCISVQYLHPVGHSSLAGFGCVLASILTGTGTGVGTSTGVGTGTFLSTGTGVCSHMMEQRRNTAAAAAVAAVAAVSKRASEPEMVAAHAWYRV